MPTVYDPENFQGRVNLAAQYIAQGKDVSCNRTFDTCFEMNDGEVVAAALYRRAQKNPKLAQNMPRYLGMDIVKENAEQFAHVKTRDLPAQARKVREERAATFSAWLQERQNA